MRLKIIRLNCVKSTNNEAIKLIQKNKLQPTMIIAKLQTKGRGTMGKKWVSKSGNIFTSIYFEINPKKINFRQYANLNSYIIKKILLKYTDFKVKIKWPNDLLIKKKKICGILQEVIEQRSRFFLIIGIGLNTLVTPRYKSFNAAALSDFSKKKIKNKIILEDIANIYEKFISNINKYSALNFKKYYKG